MMIDFFLIESVNCKKSVLQNRYHHDSVANIKSLLSWNFVKIKGESLYLLLIKLGTPWFERVVGESDVLKWNLCV